jgi:rubredoxin
MRSTLVKRHQRSCPQCGHIGFARKGSDFYGRPIFECNTCRHEWAPERGAAHGTSRDRIAPTVFDDGDAA